MARLEHQKSVLDYVTGSLSRLRMRLGTGDKRKLEEYLEAVRDIERRIQLAEAQNAHDASCRTSSGRARSRTTTCSTPS